MHNSQLGQEMHPLLNETKAGTRHFDGNAHVAISHETQVFIRVSDLAPCDQLRY
jgi:hypothetical protein